LKQILLAMSDEETLRRLKYHLSAKGTHILLAPSGERAWKLIRDEHPRMVLLDASLTSDGGRGLCRRIRTEMAGDHPFVMLLSDRGPEVGCRPGLEQGADDVVVKPVDPQNLAQRVEKLMRRNATGGSRHPLSGFPSAAAIRKDLQRHIDWEQRFALCLVNLKHFRAYNDFYGFEFGDRAICKVAEILNGLKRKRKYKRLSLGHLAADRFLLLLAPGSTEACCRSIIDQFDAIHSSLFTDSDLRRGHLVITDSTGRIRRFALVSMSIGAVTGEPGAFRYPQEVIDAALWAMGKAKLRWGNQYYLRRDGPGGLDAARNNLESKKILVINGDTVTARLLKARLERSGYQVRTAPGGQAVVQIIRNDPPDLILVDDRAAGGGKRTTGYLKNDLQAAAIPLVLSLSGHRKEGGWPAGADGYLVKPYSFQHLMSTLEEHLHHPEQWTETNR
jgi:DNA-binding response OmpR family regulator